MQMLPGGSNQRKKTRRKRHQRHFFCFLVFSWYTGSGFLFLSFFRLYAGSGLCPQTGLALRGITTLPMDSLMSLLTMVGMMTGVGTMLAAGLLERAAEVGMYGQWEREDS
jgi:hypothetical protein